MKKIYSNILIIFIISLFLEVIVFNITSYRLLFGNYEKRTYNGLKIENYSDDNQKVFLRVDNINTKVGTIKLLIENAEEEFEYKIYYTDNASSEFLGLNSKMYVPNDNKTSYIPVYLSGETKSLLISLDSKIYDLGNLNGIVINEKIPFEFNIIRFIIIFGIGVLIYFMKNSSFFKESYSEKNFYQEIALLCVFAVFFALLSFVNIYSSSEKSLGDSIIDNISTEGSIYNKDFVEAIKHHQLYLLEEPSSNLLELQDPYDNYTRDNIVKRDIDYKWDTALYNGHQYIYFGILPLLITFLPFNLLTGKYLKISFVVFLFSIFIFLLLKEILLKIIKRYFKDTPFINVFFSLVIILSGTLILYANGMSRVYEMVIIVGLYFVLQGIYFILNSIEKEKNKFWNIFLGSSFLALSVACRPTDLLVSLIVLPYFIKLFIEFIKNKEYKNLIKLIFAVSIPYLLIGIALMWYNYVRFDNIFEFGAKYQLTISNMKELKSRIFTIPTGLICNLFSIPSFIYEFPFIENHNKLMPFYGYYYIENMIGGLFILSPICLSIFGIFKLNKKEINKELKFLINILIIVGMLISIISIMMAGSNQRYLIDYAWILIIASIMIYLSLYNILKSEESKKILNKIFAIIAIYTVILGFLSGIVSEKEYMKNNSKEMYYKIKYTISFWE